LTRRDNQQIKTSLHTTTKPTIIPSPRRQTTIQIVARTSPRLSRYSHQRHAPAKPRLSFPSEHHPTKS